MRHVAPTMSRCARIATIVQEAQRGITAADIVRRLGDDTAYKVVVACCHTMAKRGHLKKVRKLKPGTLRTVTYFLPSDHTAVIRKPVAPALLLRRAIEDTPGRTLPQLAWVTGLSRRTVREVAHTLLTNGELEWVGGGKKRRLAIVDDDDAWAPPTNYLTAARAYALGLKRGAA